MAVSELSVCDSFLTEVQWARETILRINEARMRDRPLGLDATTHQPDDLFVAFARRDLLFFPYAHARGLAVGTADAYVANISTVHYYIERERREEVQSVHAKIQEITAARAQGHNMGLLSPGGNLDDFASYFALRGIPIDCYYRGKSSVGEAGAYDANIERLQAYLTRVNAATTR